MKPRIRRLVVIAGASTALGVAGCGGAASSQNAGAQSGAGSQSQAAQGAAPGPGGFDLGALATKLGVTESKLRTAMQKARPSGTPGSGSATDPTATLAKELGLSTAKVRAALQALAPAGGAGNGVPPQGVPPSGPAPQDTSTTSGSAA